MKRNEKRSLKMMKAMVIMICAVWFFIGQKTISMADFTGKVKTNAKIRQSADINSESIGGLTQGATVTVTNETTDAAGTLWYGISQGGYVRADLIEKSDSAEGNTSSTTQPTSTPAAPTAAGAEEGPETTMDLQYATIKASKAIIRSKASTNGGRVDSMPRNTTLIISGQTNGSDGNVWYYVTFTGTSGSEKTGFVRSDLINLGELVPVPEEPADTPETPTDTPEAPVDEPVITPDYEVVYEDPKGEGYAWYLHDNTGEKATRQKLEDLINAANTASINAKMDGATISKQRIAIVILVALVIIFAVVLTFMFFKLRDAYVGEDDDDYDWKADRSSRDSRPDRAVRSDRAVRDGRDGKPNREGGSRSNTGSRSDAVRQGEPVRKKSAPHEEQNPARKRPVEPERKAHAKESSYEGEGSGQKAAPKKKTKNFLADDDDFEFEFLNMKDKDRGDE